MKLSKVLKQARIEMSAVMINKSDDDCPVKVGDVIKVWEKWNKGDPYLVNAVVTEVSKAPRYPNVLAMVRVRTKSKGGDFRREYWESIPAADAHYMIPAARGGAAHA